MNIIEKGILPGNRVHQAKCNNCKTVFEFFEKEAQPYSDRDGAYFSVKCPLPGCTNVVWYYPK